MINITFKRNIRVSRYVRENIKEGLDLLFSGIDEFDVKILNVQQPSTRDYKSVDYDPYDLNLEGTLVICEVNEGNVLIDLSKVSEFLIEHRGIPLVTNKKGILFVINNADYLDNEYALTGKSFRDGISIKVNKSKEIRSKKGKTYTRKKHRRRKPRVS